MPVEVGRRRTTRLGEVGGHRTRQVIELALDSITPFVGGIALLPKLENVVDDAAHIVGWRVGGWRRLGHTVYIGSMWKTRTDTLDPGREDT